MPDKDRNTQEIENTFMYSFVQSVLQKIQQKEAELQAKSTELRNQDGVIKGYVKENTRLKDEFSANAEEVQARQAELEEVCCGHVT